MQSETADLAGDVHHRRRSPPECGTLEQLKFVPIGQKIGTQIVQLSDLGTCLALDRIFSPKNFCRSVRHVMPDSQPTDADPQMIRSMAEGHRAPVSDSPLLVGVSNDDLRLRLSRYWVPAQYVNFPLFFHSPTT